MVMALHTVHQAQLVLSWLTIYLDRVSSYLNQPLRLTEPGCVSMSRCSEYWQWSQPPLGKNREFWGPIFETP